MKRPEWVRTPGGTVGRVLEVQRGGRVSRLLETPRGGRVWVHGRVSPCPPPCQTRDGPLECPDPVALYMRPPGARPDASSAGLCAAHAVEATARGWAPLTDSRYVGPDAPSFA